jgi:hypothetical protein
MNQTKGEFKISIGYEDPYRTWEPGKLTRAGGDQEFSGAISGKGHVEWLMCYDAAGTATYVGLQDIDGTLDGRMGAFVLTATGHFTASAPRVHGRSCPAAVGATSLASPVAAGSPRGPGRRRRTSCHMSWPDGPSRPEQSIDSATQTSRDY